MRLARLDVRTWSLGAKIGITLVAAALVPMATVSVAASRAGQNAVERTELRATQNAAIAGATAVSEYLDGVSDRAEQFGTAEDVVAFIESDGATATPSYAAVTEVPDVRGVTVIDARGRIIGGSPASVIGRSVAAEPWFRSAESGTTVAGVLLPDARSGRDLVTTASPARRPGDAVVGVVTITVSSENLLFVINRTPTSAGGQVVYVDADRIVAARDLRLQGRTLGETGLGELAAAMTRDAEGTLTDVELPGRGPQVAAWATSTTGGRVVVFEPRSVFLAPIERLARQTRIALILVGVDRKSTRLNSSH